MASHEFLILYKTFKKVIKVTDLTFAAILQGVNIVCKCNLKVGDVQFRTWNRVYEDFVDCDEESDLPKEGKIEILEVSKDSNDGENSERSSNGNGSDESHTENEEVPTGNQREDEEEVTEMPSFSATPKSFPVVYRLPPLPPKVLAILTKGATKEEREKNQKKVRDNLSLRNSLMRTIKQQIEKYTDYPNGAFGTVCTTLITVYPGLADEKPLCADPASKIGYNPTKTLQACLKNKFKYVRRKDDEPTPVMKAMRMKYGGKRKRQNSNSSTEDNEGLDTSHAEDNNDEDPVAKRRKTDRPHLKLPDNAGIGENDRTYKSHLEFIAKSWNSTSPDLAGISMRMDKTVLHRLELYNKGLQDVLSQYPNLQDCHQITEDANRYFKFDFAKRRGDFFSTTRVNALYKRIIKKPKFRHSIDDESDTLNFDEKLKFVLKNLNILMNDKGNFVKPLKQRVQGAPIIYTSGTGETETFKVFLDGQEFCSNSPDLPSALDVLLSAHFLFNVLYPKESERTLRFLSEEVMCIPETNAKPQSVITLMNFLSSINAAEQ